MKYFIRLASICDTHHSSPLTLQIHQDVSSLHRIILEIRTAFLEFHCNHWPPEPTDDVPALVSLPYWSVRHLSLTSPLDRETLSHNRALGTCGASRLVVGRAPVIIDSHLRIVGYTWLSTWSSIREGLQSAAI